VSRKKATEVLPKKCDTCPFKPGSKYEHLAPTLAVSALTERSRICHQTGSNAINHRKGKPPMLCRGARDLQLAALHGAGFLSAPTDEAWAEKAKMLGKSKPTGKRGNPQ
jgi:hypothetical protein